MQNGMDRCANMSLSVHMLKRTHTWLKYPFTKDGKEISYSNVYRRACWIDKSAGAGGIPKPNVHAEKVMLCIWWSVHSVECSELLAEGPTVTADVYFERLRNLKANLENARPQQHKVYFYHDSVRPHIARTANAELMKFGCTILPLPTYSSNLAYSDYHLFPHLQNHLFGQKFQIRADIEKALEHFFKKLSPAFWSRSTNDLPNRWQRTSDAFGPSLK
ncbi:transposase [Ancylostoma ceylanicum]|uniref:Transposase n=1 Tax=Ancylostoma ceylanicum TaxID=53326 RepID=A0A0D6LKM9_9BILA|nr:transposase [Ancylostoma ceylanicum]